jgi:PAS domain S-box-containing protein
LSIAGASVGILRQLNRGGTGSEVSGLAFDQLALAGESKGIAFEALVGDLAPNPSELRSRRRRFSWDLLLEVTDRLYERVGSEQALREAARAAALRSPPPFSRLLPRFAPEALFGLMRWVPEQIYRVPELSVGSSGDGLTLSIRIPEDRRGSRAFIVFFCAVTEALAGELGFDTARCSIPGPREGLVVVRAPRSSRRRSRLASGVVVAIARRFFGEVAELGGELAATQSEREAARQEAARTEAFAGAVLAAVEDAVLVVDPATLRVRWASPATERLFGRTLAQAVGEPVGELFEPAERPRLEAWISGASASRQETSTRVGATRELDLALVDHRAEPAIAGYLLQARDVTERNAAQRAARERDQAYAALLVNLRGMAYRCRNDLDWTMELVTDGCLALTGYPPEALLLNRDVAFGSLIHPDDAGPLAEKCQANLAARKPCLNEYRIRTGEGRWRWILDVAHGVYDADGTLLAIEGFITDVDDRRKLEEQLAHLMRLDGLGRLAGGVAHDFNNYLGVVLALAALVKGELPEGSALREDVESIESASHKAAELTSQLLSFARRQVLRTTVLKLNDVVLEMDRLLRRTLGSDIELTTVLASDLWATEVDRTQLEQVLLNLAVNAREAMPNGGKLVLETSNATFDETREATHPEFVAGDWVMVAVSDTGDGIPPEIRARIFEPFLTTKPQGTGLGLATTYGAVRQAGGHIYVYSEEGKGTTFKVYLPRSMRDVEGRTPPVASRPSRGETLLLVEDNATLRSVTRRHLEQTGYRVLVAGNGVEALERARAHEGEIHLLLTDVVMPQMGGHALAVALASERPGLRVLYVSGYTENSVIHHGVPARGVAFLPKPFTPEALASKVREVLDTPGQGPID